MFSKYLATSLNSYFYKMTLCYGSDVNIEVQYLKMFCFDSFWDYWDACVATMRFQLRRSWAGTVKASTRWWRSSLTTRGWRGRGGRGSEYWPNSRPVSIRRSSASFGVVLISSLAALQVCLFVKIRSVSKAVNYNEMNFAFLLPSWSKHTDGVYTYTITAKKHDTWPEIIGHRITAIIEPIIMLFIL